MSMSKSKVPVSRVVKFCTNVFALDGKVILDENMANDACLKHIRSIEKYCLITHDKDTHDEESIAERDGNRKVLYMGLYRDYAETHGLAEDDTETGYVEDEKCESYAKKWSHFYYPERHVGDPKELHIHVAIRLKSPRKLDEIARWFNLPVHIIQKALGRGAFEDCAEYLVHAKQPHKYQYEPAAVKGNFDYQKWLDNQLVRDMLHEKYRMSMDDLNDVINDVACNGMTLQQAEELVSAPIFIRNRRLFRDARNKYIYEKMPMPPMRQAFYVDGDGSGAGKSILTKLFCKMLAYRNYGADPSKEIWELNEYIYKVGKKGVAWDKYDGQPIVFIDDRMAGDFLKEFGGHEGVKNLLETYPDKETSNIKFGDTTIVASYVVVNGIQPFEEFVNGLNGSFKTIDGREIESDTDLIQYSRRFTGIFRVYSQQDLIQILFNKGVYRNTREYEQYEVITTKAMNFKKAIERLKGHALYKVGSTALLPALDASQEITDRLEDKVADPDKIPDDLLHYGKDVYASDLDNVIDVSKKS